MVPQKPFYIYSFNKFHILILIITTTFTWFGPAKGYFPIYGF